MNTPIRTEVDDAEHPIFYKRQSPIIPNAVQHKSEEEGAYTRPILLEYARITLMRDLDPSTHSPAARHDIIVKLLEAVTTLHQRGVTRRCRTTTGMICGSEFNLDCPALRAVFLPSTSQP